MRKTPVLLYAPEGMAPPDDLRDTVHYLCHRMFVGAAIWRTNDGFTRLKAEYLHAVVRNYRSGLDWLLANGFIETDNTFVIGKKATGYRWTKGRSAVRVLASERLTERLRARSRKTFRQYSKAYKHLIRWLPRFKIDVAAADRLIDGLPGKAVLPAEQYRDLCRNAVRVISEGEGEPSACEYGRLHTPYTRLLKELRRFVTYEGTHLVNVDISNSQPLMLALLVKQRVGSAYRRTFSGSVEDGGVRSPQEAPASSHTDAGSSRPLPQPPIKASHSHTLAEEARKSGVSSGTCEGKGASEHGRTSDAERYVQLCENGTIYEFLMGVTGYTDRRLFKEHFFERVIYSTGRRDFEMAKVFRTHFPTVWAIITELKRESYKELPRMMQRAESRVMIDGVCFRLAEEYPEIPVVTIHDSIMTTPGHVETVKRLIREEYAQAGVKPTVKEEATYAEPEAENEPDATTDADCDRERTGVRSERPEVRVAVGLRPEHAGLHPVGACDGGRGRRGGHERGPRVAPRPARKSA